jgi:cation diffusion facilitator CzcD-associated flavoprotein CzcO
VTSAPTTAPSTAASTAPSTAGAAPTSASAGPTPAAAGSARPVQRVDVAVLGAGFAGLAMAVRLRDRGVTDFVVLERGDDVGGTWRDNTYPGAACDVPSHLYSLSFAPNPDWTRSFSAQPEIQAYLRRVADTCGVRPHLRPGHTVTGATWNEGEQRWTVETDRGDFSARIVVSAVGALSEPVAPDLPGLDTFGGTVFHSARWRHDHDLTGERVAVVGTGASAIQFVPQIAPDVAHLTLFQRTPPWVLPRHDRPIPRAERALYRRLPALQRLARSAIYWGRETYAYAYTRNLRLLRLPEAIARRHLARQVPDPELRAKLAPTYRLGCKRTLISNDYYPALTRPNVSVETAGIAEVREHSVVTAEGTEHPVDTIVLGTGFAVTDLPIAHVLRGRAGRLLADVWADGGMRAHRGTTVAGFPNFFLLVGPNTGLGHTSQVYMIEQQVGFVAAALDLLDGSGAATLEVRPEAVLADDAEVQARMAETVWTTGGCSSWYLDADGRNTTLWPDFTFRFKERLSTLDPADYRLAGAAVPAPNRTAVPA